MSNLHPLILLHLTYIYKISVDNNGILLNNYYAYAN
jgi:hypothetical protein